MINVLSEAEAIAKAKAFRCRVLEEMIAGANLLRAHGVGPMRDLSGGHEGYLVVLQRARWRAVMPEIVAKSHWHVKVGYMGEMRRAIYLQQYGLFIVRGDE